VLKRYLEGLAVERGLAQNSVDAYRRDLERLARALDRPKANPEAVGLDLLTADAAAIAGHLRELRRQGLNPRSVSRALSAIRGFYENLVESGESFFCFSPAIGSEHVHDILLVQGLLAFSDERHPDTLRQSLRRPLLLKRFNHD